FRRSFHLKAAPAVAKLFARTFKQGAVRINGQPADALTFTGEDWKKKRTASVARLLRAGQNEISVTVSNSFGPPALWLALELDHSVLRSDRDWQASLLGAAWQKAALASEPPAIRPGNYLFGREQVKDSLR